MKRALAATQEYFETSSGRTPEYLSWHRLFKKEFTKFLESKGATTISIGKPNHFDMNGFFTLGIQIWYFSVSDLRFFKETMLIRTAQHNKDYRGGSNCYVSLKNESEFQLQFHMLCGSMNNIPPLAIA